MPSLALMTANRYNSILSGAIAQKRGKMADKSIKVKQLADVLGLDETTIRRKINNNEIQALIAGRGFIATDTAVTHYNFTQEHKKTLDTMPTKASVISFVNHKGGCSKTTTAYTIAAMLQMFGNKVLLVDMDPQGNSTQSVLEPYINEEGITLPFPKTIKDLLLKKKNIGSADILFDEVIRPSRFGFDAIPCDLSLNSIMQDLESSSFKEVILKELLNEVSHKYDYIIIDTPPTLGFSVVSSLTASDYVLIVTIAEAFSILGVEQTLNLIQSVKRQNSVLANPRVMKILGIAISKAEMLTNISSHFVSELEKFAEKNTLHIYREDIIPKTTKIPETQALNVLITDYDAKGEAALSYFNISLLIDIEVKKDKIKEKLSK